MVLRTLETLGFEVTLTPYDPIPPWIIAARHEPDRRQNEILIRRRHHTCRETARLRRRSDFPAGPITLSASTQR